MHCSLDWRSNLDGLQCFRRIKCSFLNLGRGYYNFCRKRWFFLLANRKVYRKKDNISSITKSRTHNQVNDCAVFWPEMLKLKLYANLCFQKLIVSPLLALNLFFQKLILAPLPALPLKFLKKSSYTFVIIPQKCDKVIWLVSHYYLNSILFQFPV